MPGEFEALATWLCRPVSCTLDEACNRLEDLEDSLPTKPCSVEADGGTREERSRQEHWSEQLYIPSAMRYPCWLQDSTSCQLSRVPSILPTDQNDWVPPKIRHLSVTIWLNWVWLVHAKVPQGRGCECTYGSSYQRTRRIQTQKSGSNHSQMASPKKYDSTCED